MAVSVLLVTGHDFRFRQSKDSSRKSSSKKTLTDLTDSGVSVVSDCTPVTHPLAPCKDKFVIFMFLNTYKFASFSILSTCQVISATLLNTIQDICDIFAVMENTVKSLNVVFQKRKEPADRLHAVLGSQSEIEVCCETYHNFLIYHLNGMRYVHVYRATSSVVHL